MTSYNFSDIVLVGFPHSDLPKHYPHIELDEFVIMPNHVHGIIVISALVNPDKTYQISKIRAGLKPAPARPHSGGDCDN